MVYFGSIVVRKYKIMENNYFEYMKVERDIFTNGHAMLTDFGLVEEFEENNTRSTQCAERWSVWHL
ncbi:hypothetical protein GIB67_014339, partial [Kingdonia uniflora]